MVLCCAVVRGPVGKRAVVHVARWSSGLTDVPSLSHLRYISSKPRPRCGSMCRVPDTVLSCPSVLCI